MDRPQKSVLRAYVYLFLLGYVGGHRFYMRRHGSAIMMIFFFVAGAGAAIFGWLQEDKEFLYGGALGLTVVGAMMLVDLVMIPQMIEGLNDPDGSDRRISMIGANLDPSFQATMRRAGREEEDDRPRKSALPEGYERPWKQKKDETEHYRPGED